MDGVHFVITEQSHVGGVFKASNGISIISEGYPTWNGANKELYIHGELQGENGKMVLVPFEVAKQVFQAIDEFNKTDFASDGEKKVLADFVSLLNQIDTIDQKIAKMVKENPKMVDQFAKLFLERLEKAVESLGIKL
jgi:hypothetical protein